MLNFEKIIFVAKKGKYRLKKLTKYVFCYSVDKKTKFVRKIKYSCKKGLFVYFSNDIGRNFFSTINFWSLSIYEEKLVKAFTKKFFTEAFNIILEKQGNSIYFLYPTIDKTSRELKVYN